MDAWLEETKSCQKATEVCLEKMEAYRERKEPTPLETAGVEADPEGSDEEAAVEKVGALKDLCGNRHLAVGRRRESKERTQGDGGSKKKFAAACRRMTRRVVLARRKGRGYKGPTVEKKLWKCPECNNGIKDRGEDGSCVRGKRRHPAGSSGRP
jgi:hypothetical protein